MTHFDAQALVGGLVNFPDRQGVFIEGTIMGAYIIEDEVKVIIKTKAGYYTSAWLDNCKVGWLPDEEKKPVEKKPLR